MAPIAAVYRLVLRSQLTRAKVVGLLAMGVVGILVGTAVGSNADRPELAATRFVAVFGLNLLAPVGTLVVASAAFGEMREDATMVYLWLRPVARWKPVLGAAAAVLTITLPLVVLPLALAAAATGQGATLVVAAMASSALGVLAYTGLFLLLGLLVRRALVWGLAYILIWEGFVAQAGKTASRLAMRAYTGSIVSRLTDVPLRLATVSAFFSVAGPVVACAGALAIATWRMRTQDVA